MLHGIISHKFLGLWQLTCQRVFMAQTHDFPMKHRMIVGWISNTLPPFPMCKGKVLRPVRWLLAAGATCCSIGRWNARGAASHKRRQCNWRLLGHQASTKWLFVRPTIYAHVAQAVRLEALIAGFGHLFNIHGDCKSYAVQKLFPKQHLKETALLISKIKWFPWVHGSRLFNVKIQWLIIV